MRGSAEVGRSQIDARRKWISVKGGVRGLVIPPLRFGFSKRAHSSRHSSSVANEHPPQRSALIASTTLASLSG